MPVYEYECNSCRKIMEIQQRMADAPLTVCPQCGGEVRKLISMSSFQLKGGGWHTDGYSCAAHGKEGTCSTPPASSENTAPSPCSGAGSACGHCPAAN